MVSSGFMARLDLMYIFEKKRDKIVGSCTFLKSFPNFQTIKFKKKAFVLNGYLYEPQLPFLTSSLFTIASYFKNPECGF